MFCSNCGSRIDDNFSFCPYCGHSIHNSTLNDPHYTEFDIRDGVLVKYNGRKEKIIIPDGVVEIGESAISTEPIEVVIPSSVKRIRRFGLAIKGPRLYVPDTVIEIADLAIIPAHYNSWDDKHQLNHIRLPKHFIGDWKCINWCRFLETLDASDEFISSVVNLHNNHDDLYPLGDSPFVKNHPIRRKADSERFQREQWRKQGLCPYCGGKISIFTRKCKNCQRECY